MCQTSSDFQEKMMLEIVESEKLRVSILAGIFFVMAIVGSMGPFFLPGLFSEALIHIYKGLPLYHWIAIMMTVSCGYQLAIYWRFSFVTDRLKKVLPIIRYINVFVEISIPTGILVIMAQAMTPTVFISTPVVFFNFLSISLSALRLDFKLCAFTGLVAAAEYYWLFKTFVVPADHSGVDPFFLGNRQPWRKIGAYCLDRPGHRVCYFGD